MPTAKVHPVEGQPAVNAPKAGEKALRDAFFVSPQKRKEYGVSDGEELRWARDGEVWEQYELTNRQHELMADPEDGGMGARVVRAADSDKVRVGGESGDLILMAIPKEIADQQQSEIDGARSDFEQNLSDGGEGLESYETLFDRNGLERRMRAEAEHNRRTGLVGGSSPTAGLPLLEAQALMERRFGKEYIEHRQERLRMGGQHTAVEQGDFARLITGQRKLHGMGNSGFGRNPNSAVAQAARREGRTT